MISFQEDPKFPEKPADDAKTEEFAGSIGETEVAGSPQNEVTYEMSDVSNERHSADDNIGWSKLKTPMLPNETIAKASPVVLTKPPTSSKHKQKLR